MYESNIYLQPPGEQSPDLISDIQAGLNVNLPLVPERGKDIVATALYRADVIAFWKNTQRTRVDHNLVGFFNSKFMKWFNANVKEHYRRTADPPNSELTALERRFRNDLSGNLAYIGEHLSVELNYEMIVDSYDELKNLSRTNDIFTGALFWRWSPKTFMFLEYDFGLITYVNNTTNSNSSSHQPRIGISGDLWLRSYGTAKIGYRDVHYNESFKADYSGLAIYADFRWDITARDRLHMYVSKTSEESSYSINSYFSSNVIGGKFGHQFTERLALNAGGFIRYNGYPEETFEDGEFAKREDWIWGCEVGLKYEIREWVICSFMYDYKQRDSVFPGFNYIDHKVWGQLALTF